MDFIFSKEPFDYVFPEMVPLLKANYAETGTFPDMQMQINTLAYSEMEKAGKYHLYTAREKDRRRLIGYAGFFINYHLHTAQSLQANQDVVYITPEFRGRGIQFVRECDRALRSNGVAVVYQHVNVKHDWSRILERIGYQEIERTFARRLDRE